MSEIPGPEGADNSGGGSAQSNILILGQYIKDLSFENPGAPQNAAGNPQVELAVDLHALRVEGQVHEVALHLRVSATSEGKPAFLLELAYAGLFQLEHIPPEMHQTILAVEAPRFLFPFARRIVSDVIRDGGLRPFMIEPINFGAIFLARQQQQQQMRGGGIPTPTS